MRAYLNLWLMLAGVAAFMGWAIHVMATGPY